MQENPEKGRLMSQPQWTSISSFDLTTGTSNTPLLLFCLGLGLVCSKLYRFVEYTPAKCFKNFVPSAFNSRRQGDENPNSSVVAKSMKLIASSSYGYQIMDRSKHSVKRFMNDKKTVAVISNQMYKRLGHINDQPYVGELAKVEIEKQPIFLPSFFLQYARLRMLELY